MKNLILIAYMHCLSLSATAQNLTAQELINKCSCKTFECYNQFVLSKGFSYKKSVPYNEKTIYLFVSDRLFPADNNNLVKCSNNTSITLSSDNKGSATGIRTVVKSYYRQLLSEFLKLGYKELITVPQAEGGTLVTYSRDKAPKLLNVLTETLENSGEKYTSYNFSLYGND